MNRNYNELREYWVPVKDSENYEVSNLGRVRKKSNGAILRTSLNEPNGYEQVFMNGKKHYVHRLVAKSFYDVEDDSLQVNHIDGDKLNNNLANLEFVTRKENIRHAWMNGLAYPHTVKGVRCKIRPYGER